MLKTAVGKVKVDGRGGFGDVLKKITQNSANSAKSMAKSVGDTVQAIGKAVPDPIGAVINKVKEIIDNRMNKQKEWSDKRNKRYRDSWRSRIPGKKNIDANGVVHPNESAF